MEKQNSTPKRVIEKFYVNPKRDTQYDAALREHLAATWELPGRTSSKIARALGMGDPKNDKAYALAIMWALAAFEAEDDSTISWHPNLRLPNAVLAKKIEKSKYADYTLKFYKYAPYRKIIDRDPGRTDEVVQGVIRGYLERFGATSGLGIYKALQTKLGHVTRPVVARALTALVNSGEVVAEKVVKDNATVYSLSA